MQSLNESDERGSASIEFLGATVILLVPLVYLVIMLAQVQAASFAAESAARDVGRILAQVDEPDAALTTAQRAVEVSFADHGITVDGANSLQISCTQPSCTGGFATITVSTQVDFPGIPAIITDRVPLNFKVEAQAVTDVGTLRLVTNGH